MADVELRSDQAAHEEGVGGNAAPRAASSAGAIQPGHWVARLLITLGTVAVAVAARLGDVECIHGISVDPRWHCPCLRRHDSTRSGRTNRPASNHRQPIGAQGRFAHGDRSARLRYRGRLGRGRRNTGAGQRGQCHARGPSTRRTDEPRDLGGGEADLRQQALRPRRRRISRLSRN